MRTNFLPIGSIVALKNLKKKVMVTCIYVKDPDNDKLIYDYCGCMYPEGAVINNKNILFNGSDISEVVFMGYTDIDFQEYNNEIEDKIRKTQESEIDDSPTAEIPVDEIKEALKNEESVQE